MPQHLARSGGDDEMDGLDLRMRREPSEHVARQKHSGRTGDKKGEAMRHGRIVSIVSVPGQNSSDLSTYRA
jgi:hypothetical protein